VSDIFVSYSQTDRECAQELVEILEAQGLECWIAPRDISPSADWAAEIIDAISAARIMLLVFSASSNQSPQVRREVERAVHKGVTVLPFRIENVVPSKSLEFFLSAQHWMDAFPPPREDHYRRLAKYLSTLPPAGAPPGAEPTAAAHTRVTGIDAGTLAHIQTQLASYIGPLAEYLVRREARLTAGTEELIAKLSAELETEPDRAAFVQRCRHRPASH